MTSRFRTGLLATLAALGTVATSAASAETIVAVARDRTLIRIDVETRKVLSLVDVTATSARLLAIDLRPENGKLYGLFDNGEIYTLNPNNGKAQLRSTVAFDFSTSTYSADFNPVPDRLRVVGANGTNLRVNVDDGTFVTDTVITPPGVNPFGDTSVTVEGIAYTNEFSAAVATQLYDIDANPGAVYLQNPPNAGTLSPVGFLGESLGSFGFDIAFDGNGRNRGWIVSNKRLMEIDLGGGAIISTQRIRLLSDDVRDIAVLP